MPGPNGTRQIIDLPASGGAFVSILATGPTRRIIVKESIVKHDGVTANVAQGLIYQDLTDGFVQTYELAAAVPASQPGQFPQIVIPDPTDGSIVGPVGLPLGNGPSVNIGQGVGGATILIKAKSLTATPTSVEVTQVY